MRPRSYSRDLRNIKKYVNVNCSFDKHGRILIFFGLTASAHFQWKMRSEETQTLRAGCSKAEPKIISPAADPFPGARDGQNLIRWRWSLPLPTNPVWWGSMQTISCYRGNRPTITDPPTHRDRTDYNTLRRNVIKTMRLFNWIIFSLSLHLYLLYMHLK